MILLVFILTALGLLPSNNFYIKKSKLDFQKRVFSRVGAKIWNELPASFRESSQKNVSKRNFNLFLVDILKNMMTILIFPILPLLI